ncbi:MAG: DUF3592 domain-containing protein, partial [bacterium]
EGQPVEKVSSTSSNPPSYFEGERIRVLYIPSNPQDASIKAFFSLWGGSVIVGALGLVFFLIGGGMVLFPILRGKKEAHLREHGEAVQAEIQSVDYNERVEVNGKNPYIITAQWQDPKTSDLHVFTSANIWFDPSDYIKEDHVTAYVDKEDRSRYFIDLSFLPKVHGV